MASKTRKANELENLVLDTLWDSGTPLSSTQILNKVAAQGQVALTTVLTVLSRLADKGMVTKLTDNSRSLKFVATQSREKHAATSLLAILENAQNPALALNFFAEGLNPEMLAALKSSLNQNS